MEVRTINKIHDAGFVQTREWMLYKIREDHYPLNLLLTFELDRFDHHLFQKTIDLLVEKHEIFRTTLQVMEGHLKQVIHDHADFPVTFRYYDFYDMTDSDKKLIIQQKKLLLLNMPFNFEYGPLFRVSVFQKSDDHFEVCWSFHHIIIDSYSAGVFEADAIRIWSSLVQGDGGPLRTETVEYSKYADFENELLNTALGDSHKAYWKEQLQREFPRLLIIDQDVWNNYYKQHAKKIKEIRKKIFRLPVYDQRFIASVVRRYAYNRAGAVEFNFSGSTFNRILAFRKNYNSSLQALFIAGFMLALHKLSGQRFFVFDIPASRRTDGGLKDIIGWLASGGICYFDLDEYHTAMAFLNYIDNQLFHLSRHCIYPFEVLDCYSEIPVGSTMPVFLTLTRSEYSKGEDLQKTGIIRHDREGPGICQDMDIYLKVYNDSCSMSLLYNNFLLSPHIAEKFVLEQEGCLNGILQELLPE